MASYLHDGHDRARETREFRRTTFSEAELTYEEALDEYVSVSYMPQRFGRKVFRNGRWEQFSTPERQLEAISEALNERDGGNLRSGSRAPDQGDAGAPPGSRSLSAKDSE